jgi:hypothetical protein
MRHRIDKPVLVILLLASAIAGCDRLGFNQQAVIPDVPSDQELQRIRYLSVSQQGGPTKEGSRTSKQYVHLEQAKTCGDLELAMRWNRPPNVEAGAFHKKMVYLSSVAPADLPKNSEVFIRGKIEKGDMLPSGGAGWYVRIRDGTIVQAIETADYFEQEEQASPDGKGGALVAPNRPRRAFCGNGVYQGMLGKDPDQGKPVPLFAMLFVMDRDK